MRNQPQGWALGPAGLSWAQSVSSPSSSAVMSGPTSEQFLGGDFSRGTFRLSRQPWSCGWGQGSSLQVGGGAPRGAEQQPSARDPPQSEPQLLLQSEPVPGLWQVAGEGSGGGRLQAPISYRLGRAREGTKLG